MVVCRHIWYCPSAPPCISYQVVCLKTEPNFSRRFRRQPKESLSMILLLWICSNFKKRIQLPNSLKSIKLLLFVSIKITVKSILTQFLKLSNTCLIKKLQTCTNFMKWIQTHVDTCISLMQFLPITGSKVEPDKLLNEWINQRSPHLNIKMCQS